MSSGTTTSKDEGKSSKFTIHVGMVCFLCVTRPCSISSIFHETEDSGIVAQRKLEMADTELDYGTTSESQMYLCS